MLLVFVYIYLTHTHIHTHVYNICRMHHKRKRGYRAVNVYAEENMNTFPADSDDDDEGMCTKYYKPNYLPRAKYIGLDQFCWQNFEKKNRHWKEMRIMLASFEQKKNK